MAQVFRVVFTGRLSPAANADDAVRDFASVFKVDQARARELIGAGQERVLKSEVDEANARRYLDVLGEIGLEARIEPMTDANADAEAQRPAPPTDAGLPPPPPAAKPSPVAGGSGPGATAPASRQPSARRASSGWGWIKQAWTGFKQQPRGWLGAVALIYLISFALSMVPVIGSLATMVLGPVFAGGLMLGAQAQQRGERLRIGAAFDGFSKQGTQLALVGVLYLLGLILVFVAAGLVAMTAGALTAGSLEAMSSSDPEVVAAAVGPGVALFLLIVLLLMVPLLMAYWFAPPLVALDGLNAVEAMRTSFRGCVKNILPFVVYGLALFFILIGFSLVLGLVSAALSALGDAAAMVIVLLMAPVMLVFAAIVVLSIYTAYLDVFHAAGHSAESLTP